jgi:hypothetical protein
LVLNEKQEKFLSCIYDHAAGAVTYLIGQEELYALAEKMGFNEHEVYSYSIELKERLLVETAAVFAKPEAKIGYIKLTAIGAAYVRQKES